MTDESPLERMQRIADYRTTCKFLLNSGKQGIVFGFFFLMIGWLNFAGRETDYLYFGLGAVELLIGLHNRYRPSAFGIILDGIMLVLLGVWNLSWQAWAVAQGGEIAWFSAVFGFLVILVAINRFKRYPRVRRAFDDPPTEEQIAWLDDVVKEIQASETAQSDDVVEFRAGFLWKGKRFGDTVIFGDKLDLETLIVDRRDIEWTDKGKVLIGSNRNVRLRIGERMFAIADISLEMIARLQRWRDEGQPSEAVEEDVPEQFE